MSEDTASQAGDSKSYEAMLSQVETIIERIEGQDLGLDEVVSEVQTGLELIKKLRGKLNTTQEKIDLLRTEYEV